MRTLRFDPKPTKSAQGTRSDHRSRAAPLRGESRSGESSLARTGNDLPDEQNPRKRVFLYGGEGEPDENPEVRPEADEVGAGNAQRPQVASGPLEG